MMPFDAVFAELAKSETRVIHASDDAQLPRGTYRLREFYCEEPACDCRRVVLQVCTGDDQRVAASINYSFEPVQPPSADAPQIFLDPHNAQSDASEVLRGMFEDIIASDRAYHDRLVRHYAMWKSVVDEPEHPDHSKVCSHEHHHSSFRQEPVRRAAPKINPNEPCPCGSGKKYKRCCKPR
ncbi:MAG TPA: SEC-C metal-binding domain-containing protein [Polyangiaceae bacterium]|nr:SEC-C metal-binding domain-containing protein [Polyangiaceae bacterium]